VTGNVSSVLAKPQIRLLLVKCEIDTLTGRGGDLTEEMRPIMKNEFAGDAGVLAAWANAKFDPDGDYVRRHVPELKAVDKKHIYEPWLMPTPPKDYPAPIIGLKEGRDHFLETAEAFLDDQKAQSEEDEK